MFKSVQPKLWAFDCEWVPDAVSGRAVYKLPADIPDREVIQQMWTAGGATEDDPMPYLKTVLCRVVSIAAVTRTVVNGVTTLRLLSLPRNPADPVQTNEGTILETFLSAIGQHKPQLIGYNSHGADLKILVQRGIVNGIQARGFCQRPEKPWEGIDYFARGSDHNVDLMEIVSSWGKASSSLHEIASSSGIPGKVSVAGQQVAELWLQGKLPEIVAYNEFDAITTYLLWLRMAYFAGFFNSDQYKIEENLMRELLRKESDKSNKHHLMTYLETWEELEQLRGAVT